MSGQLLDTYPSGATVYAFWGSYSSAGASASLSGLATSDILIYKNGSVTQRSSTAGFTLLDTDGTDFDSVTGLNGISIDLNDNTDAGFYAVGSQYTVVISTVTIDSQTVTFVLGSFRIMAAEHTAGYPVATIKDGTGTGEIDTTSGGVLVSTLATQAKADVNAEVVDALNTDTYAEIGQEAPAATQTIRKMLGYLYKAWRNKSTQTATTYSLYADDASTVDQKATVSDDLTTFTRGEIASGP